MRSGPRTIELLVIEADYVLTFSRASRERCSGIGEQGIEPQVILGVLDVAENRQTAVPHRIGPAA
jgi:hypothetical protein